MEFNVAAATSEGDARRQFANAWQLAQRRRPHWVTEDDVQEAALKWWRRLSRRPAPVYLLENGTVSREFLAHWILRSAIDRRKRRWAKEARDRAMMANLRSFEVDPLADIADRAAVPVEDAAIDRIAAADAIGALAREKIDPVLHLRAADRSYGEIGAALGISADHARVRALRARRRHARGLRNDGW